MKTPNKAVNRTQYYGIHSNKYRRDSFDEEDSEPTQIIRDFSESRKTVKKTLPTNNSKMVSFEWEEEEKQAENSWVEIERESKLHFNDLSVSHSQQ